MGEILYSTLQPVMRRFTKSVKGKLSILNTEEQIKLTETLPKAYNPGGIEAVKAIYLGCDPTNNSYNIEFEYAFAHEIQAQSSISS